MRSIRDDGNWSSFFKKVDGMTPFPLRRARWMPVLGLLVLGTATAIAHPEIEDHIADLTAKIASSPSDATLYAKRGDLRRIHEDWAEAQADFDRARALDPTLDLVDLGVGRLKLDVGEPEAALAAFDRFLAANPGSPEVLVLRGDAFRRLGRNPDAAEAYDAAIRADIERGHRPSPELFIARSRARFDAGGEHRKRALGGIEEGMSVLGSPVTLELEALELEVALGMTDAAVTRLDRLASNTRRPESWLARRAEILEKAGRPADARRSWVAALEAIESLSPQQRRAEAVADLEQRARAALERLPRPKGQAGSDTE